MEGPSDAPLDDVLIEDELIEVTHRLIGEPSYARLDDVITEVTNHIRYMINDLRAEHSWHRIGKVQDNLRKVNEMAYDPVVVAIGPYHRGKAHLRKMEEFKLRCFQSFLSRTNETDATIYVTAMKAAENDARDFYEDPGYLGDADFVMMMVIDGCFIVELFTGFYRKLTHQNDLHAVDFIFEREWLLRSIQRDLLLCENQLPYFVLTRLFAMVKMEQMPQENIPCYFAMVFFSVSLEGKGLNWLAIFKDKVPKTSFDHLLGMIYHYWCPSFDEEMHDARLLYMADTRIFKFSATELREAGIKFMKKEGFEDNIRGLESMTTLTTPFGIEFNNGVLEIPRLTIDQNTESLFRNLLVYEQQSQSFTFSYITDYIRFMDILIDTEKDVQILRDSEIIQNGLGDDTAVCKMFNDFCKNLVLSTDSCYSKVLAKMYGHRSKRRHRWMANLRHNYFNSPWALISFIAAAFVILFTASQTVYAVLSYHNK